MSQKKPPTAFHSFRILGKKAQELLHRAREEMNSRKKKAPGDEELPPPADEAAEPQVTIRLSIGSVVQSAFAVLAIVIGTWLVIQLNEPIILLLLGFFVASIIDPGVRWLERRRVPRGVAILLHYVAALLLFLFLLLSLIPIIGEQLFQMADFITAKVDTFLKDPAFSLPLIPEQMNRSLTQLAQATLTNVSVDEFAAALQQFATNLTSAAQGSVRFATELAGSVLNFFVKTVIVLVLAFFIQVERESIRDWLRGFLPYRYRGYLDSKSEAIHFKIAQWARGQMTLAFAIGSLVFLALQVLGMPYALTLAALAAFTEFIPYIGPLIGAVPAVLIALTQEGIGWALVVAGVYYVVQWCENNLLVPLIMKRAVGLSPIVVIFAMLVSVSFPAFINPVLGILLSVPATTVLMIFIEDWRTHRQRRH